LRGRQQFGREGQAGWAYSWRERPAAIPRARHQCGTEIHSRPRWGGKDQGKGRGGGIIVVSGYLMVDFAATPNERQQLFLKLRYIEQLNFTSV
jgi:hypothetical protein